MPYQPHYRVTLSGAFGNLPVKDEFWSTGFALSTELNPIGSITRATLAQVAATISTLWGTHLAPRTTNLAQLQRVRVAAVGTDGRVPRDSAEAYTQGDSIATRPGTATLPVYPTQVACVVTLDSALADPTGRGRMFMPAPSISIDGDMRGLLANVEAYRTSAVAFFNAVNTAMDSTDLGRVCIASGGSLSRGIPFANRPVTGIRVGRTLDTMRSRRTNLAEEHVKGALA